MNRSQPPSFQQALQKMAALCSTAEHCESELREKLSRAGMGADDIDRIIDRLYDEGFINTTRYCHAFVRDKFRHARWGRVKIEQGLRLKQLPGNDIRQALEEELPETDYHDLLRHLILQKASTLPPDADAYARRAKLIRFALARGFTMSEALEAVGDDD